MKSKKTLKESIEAGLKLWRWLENNPGKDKIDYFIINKISIPAYGYCYACEFVFDKFTFLPDCQKCYLLELWKNKDCVEDNTVYQKWRYYLEAKHISLARDFAKKIADFHEKLLERLK